MRFPTFVSLLLVAGCLSSTSTDVGTTPTTGPFTTISTDVHDSATFAAGSIVPVHVNVTHTGLGLINVTVTYTVVSGHGVLSTSSNATDSLGHSSVIWTLGDSAGVNALQIVSGDGVDTLRVIGAIGAPSNLVAVSPDSSTIAVGDSLSLAVRIIDRASNPVPNATLDWLTTGGTVTPAVAKSDGTGTARTTFRASQAGTYVVTANLPEEATRVFTVVVKG